MEAFFSLYFPSLTRYPPSLAQSHLLSPSFIIYTLAVFLAIFPVPLSPLLGFPQRFSGPITNRPVAMQDQLTASAHAAKISRVFLQLNMVLKYRALFLVHVLYELAVGVWCCPCNTPEGSLLCRGKWTTWKGLSGYNLQHTRQTSWSLVFNCSKQFCFSLLVGSGLFVPGSESHPGNVDD